MKKSLLFFLGMALIIFWPLRTKADNITELRYNYIIYELNHDTQEACTVGMYYSDNDYPSTLEVESELSYAGKIYPVTSVRGSAFSTYFGTYVYLPNSIKTLGNSLFIFSYVTSVHLPEGIKELPDEIFAYSRIKSVKIPNSVEYIGDRAFYGSMLEKVGMPENCKTIANRAFQGCGNLKKLDLPDGLEEIGASSFSNTGIDSLIIPNSVRGIGSAMLLDCANLKYVKLSGRLTVIPDGMFAGCINLKKIDIPRSVTTIMENAFYGCGVDSLYIPESVQEIGCGSAANTPIRRIVVDEDNPVFDSREGCNAIIRKADNVLVQGSSSSTVIPNGVTKIERHAFWGLKDIRTIQIPSSLRSIEEEAFKDCPILESVTLEDVETSQLNKIGTSAFANCPKLATIDLPTESKGFQLMNRAFELCKSLVSIKLPEGLVTISENAFYDCSKLNYVSIPSTVAQIGDNAFWMNERLKTIKCFAEFPPLVSTNTFYGIDVEDCKLEVPFSSIDLYKETKYWKEFSNIVGLTTPVSSITLNAESLTLGVGETYFLTADVLPTDATDRSITWASSSPGDVVVVPATGMVIALTGKGAMITATANDGSGVVATCYVNMKKTLDIEDGTDFANTELDRYDEINYTRTFNNTYWQALFIPFCMQFEDWKDDFEIARINNVNQYDFDNDGVADETRLEMFRVRTETQPNTVYLIRAMKQGEHTITAHDATLYPAEETEHDVSSWDIRYTFYGTYTTISGATMFANGYYSLGGGSLHQAASDLSSLKPGRWYMTITDRTGKTKSVNEVKLYLYEEGEETGVEQYLMRGQGGNVQEQLYDLNGCRVSESQARQRKGIFVRGGKKVIFK